MQLLSCRIFAAHEAAPRERYTTFKFFIMNGADSPVPSDYLQALYQIDDFLDFYDPVECCKNIDTLVTAAFGSDEADAWEGKTRSDLIFLTQNLKTIITALHKIRYT